MNEDLHKQFDEMITAIPAFSAHARRVLHLTSNSSDSTQELVRVIECDPGITLKILKLVNSAYFNLPRRITSIHQSVIYLGFYTIKNLALSIASLEFLPHNSEVPFDTQAYLRHSLSTAAIARLLHQKFNHSDSDASECFIAGLLHDIGKVVYARVHPKGFAQMIELYKLDQLADIQAERRIFGADHSQIGAMLAKKWNFPRSLWECIGAHHDFDIPGNELRDTVIAANRISKKFGCGGPVTGDDHELPPAVLDRFGMELNDLIEYLGDFSVYVDYITSGAGDLKI